jgi:hypothetical protein
MTGRPQADDSAYDTLSSPQAQTSGAVVDGPKPLQSRGMARVEEFLAYSNCSLNFFLAWTTAGDKFTLRYRRTLESTLKFHPMGCVVVYSPTLTLDYFQVGGRCPNPHSVHGASGCACESLLAPLTGAGVLTGGTVAGW